MRVHMSRRPARSSLETWRASNASSGGWALELSMAICASLSRRGVPSFSASSSIRALEVMVSKAMNAR